MSGRPEEQSLAGKVGIVTGSTRGIGAGIAWTLARSGARVIIHGLTSDSGNELVSRIQKEGGEAGLAVSDLRDEKACRSLVGQATDFWGRLDILVNNAGIFPRGNIETTSVALWDEIFTVNLRAPFILCQEAVKLMKSGEGGCII